MFVVFLLRWVVSSVVVWLGTGDGRCSRGGRYLCRGRPGRTFAVPCTLSVGSPPGCNCSSCHCFGRKRQRVAQMCPLSILIVIFSKILHFRRGNGPITIDHKRCCVRHDNLSRRNVRPDLSPGCCFIRFGNSCDGKGGSLPLSNRIGISTVFSCFGGLSHLRDVGTSGIRYATVFCHVLTTLLGPLGGARGDRIVLGTVSPFLRSGHRPFSLSRLRRLYNCDGGRVVGVFGDRAKLAPCTCVYQLHVSTTGRLLVGSRVSTTRITTSYNFSDCVGLCGTFVHRRGLSPVR